MDSSLLSPPMPASPFQQNPSLDMISIPQIITAIKQKAVTEESRLAEAAREVQSK